MSKITVEINCRFCPEKTTVELLVEGCIPDGDYIFENGLCQKHAPIGAWRDAQCPGCVSAWGECPLWEAFAHERYRHNAYKTLGASELKQIRDGTCPRRTNGTMGGVIGGPVRPIDLSDRAPLEAGTAFMEAILEYWTRYPQCSPEHRP